MPGRYGGWARLVGFDGARSGQIAAARQLLGRVFDRIARGGLHRLRQRVTLDDGSVLDAQFDGVTPSVHRLGGRADPATVMIEPGAQLWFPRGFVVRPRGGESDSDGWGLPIVLDGTDPYEPSNLAPGLATARWTPAGAWPDVLLSRDVDAGYAPRRGEPPLPAGYEEAFEPPTFVERDDKGDLRRRVGLHKPTVAGWRGYRPEFVDFLDPVTRVPDPVRRAIFAGVNETRAAAGRAPLVLPLRGRWDEASALAGFVDKYGTQTPTPLQVEVDSATFPARYAQPVDRHDKDGAASRGRDVLLLGNGAPADVLAAWTADPAAEAVLTDAAWDEAPTTLAIGQAGAATSAAFARRDQWLAVGNKQWYGTDPALPPLSWWGEPAMGVSYLTQGGFDPPDDGPTVYLDALGYLVGSTLQPYYSQQLFARGRVFGTCPDTIVGAGVQRVGDKYRVLAIGWRADDVSTAFGFRVALRRFHVWFVDTDGTFEDALHCHRTPVGAFDADANPGGWHYAGAFEAPDATPTNPFWLGPTVDQMPALSPDGTTLLVSEALYWLGTARTLTSPIAVADGVLDLAFADAPVDTGRPDAWLEDIGRVGVAFADDGTLVEAWVGEALAPFGGDDVVHTALWWRGQLRPLGLVYLGEDPAHPKGKWLACADVVRGAFVYALAAHPCSGESRYELTVLDAGVPVAGGVYTLPDTVIPASGIANAQQPGFVLNGVLERECLIGYARRGADRMLGYELRLRAGQVIVFDESPAGLPDCVSSDHPVHALASDLFLGAAHHFTGGALAELTGAPAVCFYPIGAV